MYAPVYSTSSFQISLHKEHLHLEFGQFKLQPLSIKRLSVAVKVKIFVL